MRIKEVETTAFFIKNFEYLYDADNNRWFNLDLRSEKPGGFINYEYDITENEDFGLVNESLEYIFDNKNDFDFLIEIYKEFDEKKGLHSKTLGFKVAKFEIVNFNLLKEFREWGDEKKIKLTENMLIRYTSEWNYSREDFDKIGLLGNISNIILSINRDLKLKDLGL